MKMLDQLLSSKSIRDNGKVVYDSEGDHEQTCVVFRHYHGSRATAGRLAKDMTFKNAFLTHQEEVLTMARTFLGGIESSLLVEGMRKDQTHLNEGFFMNSELDQTLASFRVVEFLRDNKLSHRVSGIEPTLEELGQIFLSASPNFGFFGGGLTAESIEKIEATVQTAKKDAIIRGFMEGGIATGILIIGAAHTKHGTPAPDLSLECIEDLFQSRQQEVRVVVIEPKTPVWSY